MTKRWGGFAHYAKVKACYPLLLALLPLSACAAAAPPSAASCPIVQSSDWRAWVNAMPSPGAHSPYLNVAGKVTVPSGEWSARLAGIRVMESYPVQVVVELEATSSGAGIQIPLEREVRGSWPSEEQVGSVTVTCGGTVLARISPVQTAH